MKKSKVVALCASMENNYRKEIFMNGPMGVVNDAKSVKEQAKLEVVEELQREHVTKYKLKLKELNSAKRTVKNLEREIEAMEDELGQEIEDINA